MKKLLLTLSLAAMLLTAKSQIIITGYLHDPSGTDADAAGAKEYIQFKATQAIDFSVTPFSVVTCNNAGASQPTGFPDLGWATGGTALSLSDPTNNGAKTYQFNLTSGTVQAGDFFYVGGDVKRLGGTASYADMSGAKWISSRNYFTVQSDIDVMARKGNSPNILANSGNVAGIAVFSGTVVTSTSIPLDVIFYGGGGNVYQADPELGYRIGNNDYYAISNGEFFRKGTNTAIAHAHTTGVVFIKLGGDYNTATNIWNVKRVATPVTITTSSLLADIETGTGVTTLPVAITSFTAKTNKSGTVNLAWSTASEQDNSHFEINRSTDGVSFTKIGQVQGSGNSSSLKNYSYTDETAVSGINYYQLKQVDFDGQSELSKVVSAKVGLSKSDVTVAVSNNRSTVRVTYQAAASGKATFTVYSVSGAKLAAVTQNVNSGTNEVNIPVALGNSLHLLNVNQDGATSSVKF